MKRRNVFSARNQPLTKRRRLAFEYSPKFTIGDLLDKSRVRLEQRKAKAETKAVKSEKTVKAEIKPEINESDLLPQSLKVSDPKKEDVETKQETPDSLEFVRPPRKYGEPDNSSESADRDLVQQMYSISQPSYKNDNYDDHFQYSWFRGNTRTRQRPRKFLGRQIPLSFTQQRKSYTLEAGKTIPKNLTALTPTPKKKKKVYRGDVPKRLSSTQRQSRREKQIKFGKATEGYINYIRLVPKNKREETDPKTPDIIIDSSKRSFDKVTRAWRRELHSWDTAKLSASQVEFLGKSFAKEAKEKKRSELEAKETKEQQDSDSERKEQSESPIREKPPPTVKVEVTPSKRSVSSSSSRSSSLSRSDLGDYRIVN